MSGTRIASSLYLAMNLTERLVMSYRFKPLDVCIVRPSLILGAAKSPSPGFIGAPQHRPSHSALLHALASWSAQFAGKQRQYSARTSPQHINTYGVPGMQGRGAASREASWALPLVHKPLAYITRGFAYTIIIQHSYFCGAMAPGISEVSEVESVEQSPLATSLDTSVWGLLCRHRALCAARPQVCGRRGAVRHRVFNPAGCHNRHG